MADHRPTDGHPIQTSAVIVLGDCKSRGSAVPPPSPPTPCLEPADAVICEPTDCFRLAQHDSPPESSADSEFRERRLRDGIHVLNTEAHALSNLTRLYETEAVARHGFNQAVQAITRQRKTTGKLVVAGVGKSGHIGKKLVATFQSLAIRAVFLHPTEALHGDLGIVGPDDTLIFITYSGKTKELLLLLPHLDESLPTILITSHTRRETCEFLKHRPHAILLPAPIPQPEAVSFGVSAPSTSTTAALALGDALAITAAHELHPSVSATFAKNHPGGAIGAVARRPHVLGHLSVAWSDITHAKGLDGDSLGADLLRAGYNSTTGWVRVHNSVAAPSKIRDLSTEDICRPLKDIPNFLTAGHQMLAMSSDTTIRQARDFLKSMQEDGEDEARCGNEQYQADSIISVTKGGSIIGVLEVEQVLNYEDP